MVTGISYAAKQDAMLLFLVMTFQILSIVKFNSKTIFYLHMCRDFVFKYSSRFCCLKKSQILTFKVKFYKKQVDELEDNLALLKEGKDDDDENNPFAKQMDSLRVKRALFFVFMHLDITCSSQYCFQYH